MTAAAASAEATVMADISLLVICVASYITCPLLPADSLVALDSEDSWKNLQAI